MHWQFLEISLASNDMLASLDFYRRLGFAELATNDAHAHPYAVFSDGRASVGLHARDGEAPGLSFVLPGLAEALSAGVPTGLNPVTTRLGDDDFHRASFVDPDGHALHLLEARTFSPSGSVAASDSVLGYFEGIALPCNDLSAGARRWESLGFVAIDDSGADPTAVTLTSDALNVVLQAAAQPREPALLFSNSDVPAQIAGLKQRGIELIQEIPGDEGALLRTPEGLLIRLLQDA